MLKKVVIRKNSFQIGRDQEKKDAKLMREKRSRDDGKNRKLEEWIQIT